MIKSANCYANVGKTQKEFRLTFSQMDKEITAMAIHTAECIRNDVIESTITNA